MANKFSITIRGTIKAIVEAIKKLAAPSAFDADVKVAFDKIEDMWWKYIDSSEGFGTDNTVGNINYTGKSRAGISTERPNNREWRVVEGEANLKRIRLGSPATGKFNQLVYRWALKKILEVPDAVGSKKGEYIEEKQHARAMTMQVANFGTSTWYEKHRYNSGNKGFDYGGYFFVLKEPEILRVIDGLGLKVFTNLKNVFTVKL